MPTFIQVRGANPLHKGTHTPNRFWPNSQVLKLEVVPDKVVVAWLDEHKKERKGAEDPASRALDIAGGPYLSFENNVLIPDPSRISESGLDHIRGNEAKRILPNQHLSTLEEGEAGGAMAQASIDQARAVAARASEKLADAEIKIEELSAENVKLRARIAELTDDNAAIAEELGAEQESASHPVKGKKGSKT